MGSGTEDYIPTTTEDRETITYGAVDLDVVDAERSLAFGATCSGSPSCRGPTRTSD